MVILITYEETDKFKKKTGRILVSHGYNTETGQTEILPPVPPSEIGYFNSEMWEWILK